jgi:UMF1 family MFS transporter
MTPFTKPLVERQAQQRAWYFYDFGNSAFSSTVVTLFLGPYLTSLAKNAADSNGMVHPLLFPIEARAIWGYSVALSVILQALTLPLIGAITDRSGRKRDILALTAFLGAAATIAMFQLEGSNYQLGVLLFLIANVAFGASQVVYNAFLLDIATPDERDGVSSRGWGIGYLGGGLVLAGNLALFANAERLGISEAMAVRISLASAGIWWALFTIPPILKLKNVRPALEGAGHGLGANYLQFVQTLKHLGAYPQTMWFLIAYLLYNDAVQAVIALAAQFGNDELKIPMSTLTQVILMVQFVAFGGALAFNWLASRIKAKWAVVVALLIWIAVVSSMYFSVRTTGQFWIAAAVVAVIMGGTQALSRSLFSLMIPEGKDAEYFGIYEIADKGTSWIAPAVFGLALQFTRSYRVAILSLIVFFVLGLLCLLRVDVARAAREARGESGVPAAA